MSAKKRSNIYLLILLILGLMISHLYYLTHSINISKNNDISAINVNPKQTSLEESEIINNKMRSNSQENDANSGGDAGDQLALATFIIPGNYNGTINTEPDEKDYYAFSVAQGSIINATMKPVNHTKNFDLSLYGLEGKIIKEDFQEAGLRETIIWSVSSSGNYSILIAPSTPEQNGNYSFAVLIQKQNDYSTNTDAGNTINSPLLIVAGDGNGTLLHESDLFDFYSINLTKGVIINVFVNSTNTTNIDLTFYRLGEEVANSKRPAGFNESILWAVSKEGVYTIGVELKEVIDSKQIIPYYLAINVTNQNDANSGTDAGNTPEEAHFIIPLTNSIFFGELLLNGDTHDYYRFDCDRASEVYISLELIDTVNFDLSLYNATTKSQLAISENVLEGATEAIWGKSLTKGSYYLLIEFVDGTTNRGNYSLRIGRHDLVPNTTGNSSDNNNSLMTILISTLVPISIIILIILSLYFFTNVRIPLVSDFLDKRFNREGKGETVQSLKYALKIRENTIENLRADMINKDAKRAKDLETIHRLEEDQKTKSKVIEKIRKENEKLKNQLEDLKEVNEDLANIIDSTIRRQLAKSTKQVQKAKVSSITSLLWLSENRLIQYINSIPLLNERYILDQNNNYILSRDYAREITRQAYWKRVGAMHLKKIKQVKVTSLSEDTNIGLENLKEILRELVERKEIPAPIHMDREALLLSISDELISELAEIAQTTPVISLNEISKSYDATPESARVIFEKISEEQYAEGEFITDDTFVVFNLLTDEIINEGSINLPRFAKKHDLEDEIEELAILIEKLRQKKKIKGVYLTEEDFLCFNDLPEQLEKMIRESINDIEKGDTRRMVFDIGSVLESFLKEKLMIDIHECDEVDNIPQYQNIIESRELGRIIRAIENTRVDIPAFVELKSLNRFWAQKIKHTKPGGMPYIPTIDEAQEFLFDANRALNKLASQKIPPNWKIRIAKNLLSE
jgi:hypothetical protein